MLVIFTVANFTYYTVSGNYIFDNFEAAMSFASSSSAYKNVVLMNNATLTAGTYTVPSGVTLLIPYDSANTLYKTGAVSTGTYSTPTATKEISAIRLTLSDGTVLNDIKMTRDVNFYCVF